MGEREGGKGGNSIGGALYSTAVDALCLALCYNRSSAALLVCGHPSNGAHVFFNIFCRLNFYYRWNPPASPIDGTSPADGTFPIDGTPLADGTSPADRPDCRLPVNTHALWSSFRLPKTGNLHCGRHKETVGYDPANEASGECPCKNYSCPSSANFVPMEGE